MMVTMNLHGMTVGQCNHFVISFLQLVSLQPLYFKYSPQKKHHQRICSSLPWLLPSGQFKSCLLSPDFRHERVKVNSNVQGKLSIGIKMVQASWILQNMCPLHLNQNDLQFNPGNYSIFFWRFRGKPIPVPGAWVRNLGL